MNLNNIAFKIIKHSSPEFKKAVKLREEILRKPLGLTFLPEELEAEKDHVQIEGFQDDEVVSTAVLIPEGKTYKIQRVVEKKRPARFWYRIVNDGILRILCKRQRIHSIYCHVGDSAVNLYLKNNYASEGDYFDKDTIPHLKMRKVL